jgi:hypothetical protein
MLSDAVRLAEVEQGEDGDRGGDDGAGPEGGVHEHWSDEVVALFDVVDGPGWVGFQPTSSWVMVLEAGMSVVRMCTGSYTFAAARLQAAVTNAMAEADVLPLEVDGMCCFNFR